MFVYFCPECQSGKINGTDGEGVILKPGKEVPNRQVECSECGWKGNQGDLMVSAVAPDIIGGDAAFDVVKGLVSELRNHLLVTIPPSLMSALCQVGLISSASFENEMAAKAKDPNAYTPNMDMGSRLLAASLEGLIRGILEEMSVIEKISARAKELGQKPDFRDSELKN